jgi:hypothetical protein
MLDIQTLAGILLAGRLVSVTFLVLVLIKQWRLLKLYVEPEIRGYRKLLFVLSCIILVGNFIPIVIDTATLFVETNRNPNVRSLSIMYALSNSATAAISAATIWLIYRTAGRRQDIDDEITAKQLVKTDKTESDLRSENAQLKRDGK